MKKMNKMYEAPVAEVFEMQMPTVLMASQNMDWDPTGGFEG
jgi:hypothetical protein